MKETQTKAGLEKFLTQVGEKTGITMSGSADNMMMTSPELSDAFSQADLAGRIDRAKILKQLSPSTDENSVGFKQIMRGEKAEDIDFGLTADTKFTAIGQDPETKKRNFKMQYQGVLSQTAGNIMNMSEAEIAGLRMMDPEGQSAKALTEQRDKIKDLIKAEGGDAMITSTDSEGNKTTESATDALKKFEDAILRLEGAQGAKDKEQKEQVVGTMKVTKLEVENWPKLWG